MDRRVRPGDGPQNFHVVLLDNGTHGGPCRCLRDRQTLQLHPMRRVPECLSCVSPDGRSRLRKRVCGADWSRSSRRSCTAYGSRPQSLPYASSSLCGACYEVCPVKINIPEVLIHLRQKRGSDASRPASRALTHPRSLRDEGCRFYLPQRASLSRGAAPGSHGRVGHSSERRDGRRARSWISWLPGYCSVAGRATRDLQAMPEADLS